ncbi:MAG TPA: GGDEF domain-containing protein [Solirubrobacteraceae bacterium]|jgi:GGDEF domain-containing protein|nr:GGDEF domain-containing protein [Solirubrobacteraceae bacterium]
MAATHTDDTPTSAGPSRRLPLATAELECRLEEEVSRAERHGTALSCLLVGLQDPAGLARAHGSQLPEQAIAYMSLALGRQLRRFDRVGRLPGGQLLVLLPGADQRRGEIVARRAIRRLRAVKLEQDGERHTIAVRVGLASWREGVSARELVEQSRRAACAAAAASERRRQTPPGAS